MIIFALAAILIVGYNTEVDKKASETKTTKEVYEAHKRERQ